MIKFVFLLMLATLGGCDYLKELKYKVFLARGEVNCRFTGVEGQGLTNPERIQIIGLDTNAPEIKIDDLKSSVYKKSSLGDNIILFDPLKRTNGKVISLILDLKQSALAYTETGVENEKFIHNFFVANCK